MTTIAYKDGILASDRQTTCGNSRKECAKMWAVKGAVIAVAGVLSDGLKFRDWWQSGKPDNGWHINDDTTIVVVDLNTGELVEYDSNMVPMQVWGQFDSWGSGCDLAMGAMEAGADAVRAVDIGIRHDAYSGIGLSVLNLNEIKKVRNYADWDHWISREK